MAVQAAVGEAVGEAAAAQVGAALVVVVSAATAQEAPGNSFIPININKVCPTAHLICFILHSHIYTNNCFRISGERRVPIVELWIR